MNDGKNISDIQDDIVGFFMRHLVPIFFTFKRDTDSCNDIVTTFVLSVNDQWFLVTAGHCIKMIQELTTEHGYQIAQCYLIDSLGLGAKHRELISFNYQDANPRHIPDSTNFDYGFITLSPYYRQLLEKNNIKPLDEKLWKFQPSSIDFYALIGIAGELVKFNPKHADIAPTLHPITPLDERPPGFSKADIPLFYGQITLGEEMTSIKGMSGAPIFAFHANEQGRLRYWLIALQSRWLPDSHSIAACPTILLGEALETLLEEVEEFLKHAG